MTLYLHLQQGWSYSSGGKLVPCPARDRYWLDAELHQGSFTGVRLVYFRSGERGLFANGPTWFADRPAAFDAAGKMGFSVEPEVI